MSKKLLFIFNPYSGKGLIREHLVSIVDIMVKAGYEVTIYPTQCKGDATRKVIEEAAGYDRIVCSGGDGTLDEVVAGFIEGEVDLPLGYIPAGSTNDFANSIGLPKDMEEAAKAAVGENEFPCDIGDFNGESFVYVAAFGLFTEVSYETPQEMKNLLGHAAYLLEGAKHLHEIPAYTFLVNNHGQIFQDEFIYGMITNSESVGGIKGMTGPNVDLSDGLFEVTLIKMPRNPIELNDILSYLTGLTDDTDMVYSFKTDELKLYSRGQVRWTLDGEYGGNHEELLIRNLRQRIRIMV